MKEKYTCKQCGKVFYRRRNHGKCWFCSRECANEWMRMSGMFKGKNSPSWKGGRRKVICKYCGKEFYLYPSRIKEGRRFCSRECANEWMRMSGMFKGKNSPSWKGGKIKVVCENCGKSFTARPSRERRFCSKKCFDDYQTSPEVTIKCEYCGKSFTIRERELKRGRRFCSHECYGKWVAGENHPFWIGGISDESYPNEFNYTFKRFIRERDGYTCLLCGEKGSHVHHIDYDKDNTDPSNFVILCRSCHSKTNINRDYWPDHLRTLFEKKEREKSAQIAAIPEYSVGVLSNDFVSAE